MLIALLVTASDNQENLPLLIQQRMMRKFIGAVRRQGVRNPAALAQPFLYQKRDIDDACVWRGVKCDSQGFVRKIQWDTVEQRKQVRTNQLFIQCIPPTVHLTSLRNQDRSKMRNFQTRCLPKVLRQLCIAYCGMVGTVDMTTLPSTLTILDLPGNSLHGTVKLMKLPMGLKKVDLTWSYFDLIAVDNLSLPKDFGSATFYHATVIQKIEITGEPVDERIIVRCQDRTGTSTGCRLYLD